MKKCNWTKEKLDKALQNGISSREIEELVEHLEGGCEECEDFFAGLPEEYEEVLLFSAMVAQGDSSDQKQTNEDLGRKRAVKAAGVKAAELYGHKGGKLWKKLMPVAAVLVLAVVLGFYFLQGPDSETSRQKVKGPALPKNVKISLQYLTLKGPDGPGEKPVVKRGLNRATLRPSTRLLFRYRVSRAAHVYLVKIGPDKNVEILRTEQNEKGGEYDFRDKDGIYSLPLPETPGPQTFCAMAFAEGPSSQKLKNRVLSNLAANRNQQKSMLNNDRTDCFEVKVESWQGSSVPQR